MIVPVVAYFLKDYIIILINACLWNNKQWLLVIVTYQGFEVY